MKASEIESFSFRINCKTELDALKKLDDFCCCPISDSKFQLNFRFFNASHLGLAINLEAKTFKFRVFHDILLAARSSTMYFLTRFDYTLRVSYVTF